MTQQKKISLCALDLRVPEKETMESFRAGRVARWRRMCKNIALIGSNVQQPIHGLVRFIGIFHIIF